MGESCVGWSIRFLCLHVKKGQKWSSYTGMQVIKKKNAVHQTRRDWGTAWGGGLLGKRKKRYNATLQ